MSELIFAYFGAISLVLFLLCAFVWILKEFKRIYKGKYYDNLRDKLDKVSFLVE